MIGVVPAPAPVDDAPLPDDEPKRLFVRIITARSAPPWDQSRQAQLEARLGAPARLTDIVYRLRRLDAWRLGQPARFAAIYVHAEDARRGIVAKPVVDGRLLRVDFTDPAQQLRKLRRIAPLALAAAAAVTLIVAVGWTVVSRHGQAAAALASIEQVSEAKLKQAEQLRRQIQQTRKLDSQGLKGRRITDLLADVNWASKAKAPSAHIKALHWDSGFMAVEADGDEPPFSTTDRPVRRTRAPVRPGVWLWGVGSMEPWGAPASQRSGP